MRSTTILMAWRNLVSLADESGCFLVSYWTLASSRSILKKALPAVGRTARAQLSDPCDIVRNGLSIAFKPPLHTSSKHNTHQPDAVADADAQHEKNKWHKNRNQKK